MSQAVYSVQLAAQHDYVGTLDVLVPSGFKTVVRDIDFSWLSSTASRALYFYGNIGNILWAEQATVSAFGIGNWRGRAVFEAGQKFQIVCVSTSADGFDFQVNGYHLALP